MKWKSPEKYTEPKKDSERQRTIFAIFPRRCSDGYTRWLEKVRIVEQYHYIMTGDGESIPGWEEINAHPPVGAR